MFKIYWPTRETKYKKRHVVSNELLMLISKLTLEETDRSPETEPPQSIVECCPCPDFILYLPQVQAILSILTCANDSNSNTSNEEKIKSLS